MHTKLWVNKILRLFLVIIILCSELQTVEKVFASELSFYNHNTKSNVNYAGKQVSYTYNNKKLNLSHPGIILSGTALVDCEELFVNELGLIATVEDKKITISDGINELLLTLGSKNVKYNGSSQKMSIAPVKLEFKDGTVKYYVPSRFVAETFGYNYIYNSENSEAKITKTLRLLIDQKTVLYSDTFYSVNYINQPHTSELSAFSYKNTVYASAKQLFTMLGCKYKEENEVLSVSKNEINLQINSNSTLLSVNNIPFNMDAAPINLSIGNNTEPEIYVPLEYIVTMLGYKIDYNEIKCSYVISDTEFTGNPEVHPELKAYFASNIIQKDQKPINTYFTWFPEDVLDTTGAKQLTKVNAYSVENADVLELYGVNRNDVNDFMDNSTIIFELKSVVFNASTKFYSDNYTPHLKYVLLTTINNSTKLFIMAPFEDEWIFEETEECLRIYFLQSELDLNDIKTYEEVPYDIKNIVSEIKVPDDMFVIPVPECFDSNLIQIKDNYSDKNITLVLPGNLSDYYQKNSPINPYDFISNTDILYNVDTNQTTITLQTEFICGYEESYNDKYFALKLGKPKEIYNKIIVLDAGHGGKDPGALRENINEKDINLGVIKYAEELFKNSDIKVYCTRTTDKFLSLEKRTAFVKEVQADLFISVHVNSSELDEVYGTEIYYYKGNKATSDSGLTSYKLAKALSQNMYKAMDTKSRGVISNDYYVVHYNSVPAALIELGFISNTAERTKLANKYYQYKAANAIFESVIDIFSAYPTVR